MVEETKDAGATAIAEAAPEPSPEQKVEGESKPEEHRGPTGWIPKVRLDEVITERNEARDREAREREERIRLEERLKALDAVEHRPVKKTATRAELDDLVNRGELTKVQADEYMDETNRRAAVAEAIRIADAREDARRRAERRDAEIADYRKHVPDLGKRGSDAWNQAAEAYQEIVFLQGPPSSRDQELTYELMAVKATFGRLDSLRKRKDAETANRANRETYNEVGNGNQTNTETTDAKVKKLTPRQQAYFQRMSDAGRYPGGIDEYLKELAFERPRV